MTLVDFLSLQGYPKAQPWEVCFVATVHDLVTTQVCHQHIFVSRGIANTSAGRSSLEKSTNNSRNPHATTKDDAKLSLIQVLDRGRRTLALNRNQTKPTSLHHTKFHVMTEATLSYLSPVFNPRALPPFCSRLVLAAFPLAFSLACDHRKLNVSIRQRRVFLLKGRRSG